MNQILEGTLNRPGGARALSERYDDLSLNRGWQLTADVPVILAMMAAQVTEESVIEFDRIANLG